MMQEAISGLGSEAFIGRKEVLERTFAQFADGTPVIQFCGECGSGKTMLMRRTAAHAIRKQYALVEARGKLYPEILLELIFRRAAKKGVTEAPRIFYDIRRPLREKILWFADNFLIKEPIAVMLDDFHENLDEKGNLLSSRLKEFIFYLRDIFSKSRSRLILAGERPVQGISPVWAQPFEENDLAMFLDSCAALNRMSRKSAETLVFDVGARPLTLRWLDAVAVREMGTRKFEWTALKKTIPRLDEAIFHKTSETADFTGIILERLLHHIGDAGRRLLEVMSLFPDPAGSAALEAAGVQPGPQIRRELEDAGLITYSEKRGLYGLHAWASRYFQARMAEPDRLSGHKKIAAYCAGLEKKSGELRDLRLELNYLRHVRESGDIDALTGAALQLEDHLSRHGHLPLGFDILDELNAVVPGLPEQARRAYYRRITMYHALFGKDEELVRVSANWKELAEKAGETRDMAQADRQIGMGCERLGKFEEAADAFEQAFLIERESSVWDSAAFSALEAGKNRRRSGRHEEAFQWFRTSAELYRQQENQAGEGRCFHAAGKTFEDLGRFEEALSEYRKALECFFTPETEREKGGLFHDMGNACFLLNRVDEAMDYYQLGLSIHEKLEDWRSAGYSLGQVGMIRQRKNEWSGGLESYTKALEMFRRAGDDKGESSALHQLGRISQDMGERDQALEYLEESVQLREKRNDWGGMALGYGQLGVLHMERGEYEAALKSSAKAFVLFNQLQSKGVISVRNTLLALKEKVSPEMFDAVLKEFNIQT